MCLYTHFWRIEITTDGFQWCFENVHWQSFMIDGLKTYRVLPNWKRCIQIIISFYILLHMIIQKVSPLLIFIYVYFLQGMKEIKMYYVDVQKESIRQECWRDVVGRDQKIIELYTTIHVYIQSEQKLKGPWQYTGIVLVIM